MQPPDAFSVGILVGAIAVLALALDRVGHAGGLDSWRSGLQAFWPRFTALGAEGLSVEANRLFCDLFDFVYDKRAFSARRICASVLTSLIGILFFTLLLGPGNTFFFGEATHDIIDQAGPGLLAVVLIVLFFLFCASLNIIPDYVSLAETRLVLHWSRGKGHWTVLGLLLLDLVLTALIFVGFFFIYFYVVVGVGLMGYPFDWQEFVADLPRLHKAEGLLVFYLTTFLTSFIWLLFVCSFFLIRLLYRLAPAAKYFYEEVGRSTAPAASFAALVNAVIISVYMLWLGLDWLLG